MPRPVLIVTCALMGVACRGQAATPLAPPPPDFRSNAATPVQIDDPASDGRSRLLPEETVYFGFDSTLVAPAAVDDLRAVARWAANNRHVDLVVEGYADPVGPARYNLWLSERRAAMVARYLERSGVADGRIIAYGLGELGSPVGQPSAARRVRVYAVEPAEGARLARRR